MAEWTVRHLTLDGETHDRDNGWPDLELELHPVGIMLPKADQFRHLRVCIGKSETWIDPEGIEELMEFLKEET